MGISQIITTNYQRINNIINIIKKTMKKTILLTNPIGIKPTTNKDGIEDGYIITDVNDSEHFFYFKHDSKELFYDGSCVNTKVLDNNISSVELALPITIETIETNDNYKDKYLIIDANSMSFIIEPLNK